jgi:NAD(P)-dependent dehydrogenase (short-subunit alcohol dehydrogenase family)
MGKLSNKVAVVTGSSKGIGAGIAKGLAAEGAAVVVNYASSKEGAERVVSEIKSKGGKAVAIHGDVSKAKDVQRLFVDTKKAFGRLDVLVNNAASMSLLLSSRLPRNSFTACSARMFWGSFWPRRKQPGISVPTAAV